MVAYKVTVVLFFISLVFPSDLNPLEPYFRNDYKYIGRQEAFYKVHAISRNWKYALSVCDDEGAHLVYPTTKDEAISMTKLMSEYLPKENNEIWLGAHDIFSEGVYVNLDGEDLSNMFSTWSSGEPNDAGNNEDCIAMSRDEKLNDLNCESRLPFVCKKALMNLTTNPICETADLAYVPNSDKSRCYKVHTTPKSWHEAFATCHAEQSYLTILNSADEVKFIVNLLAKVEDKIKTPYYKGHVGIGFHDLYHEGLYLTIHGETLQAAGYEDWQGGQPDNYKGAENCGSITRQGKLNDISCTGRLQFICERELGDPNAVEIYSRFQTHKT